MSSNAPAFTPPGVPSLDFDPFCDEVLGDPYSMHAAMRDAGPVVWLERYQVYAVARFQEVSEVLADHGTFVSARGVGISDFAVEPPSRPQFLLLETDPPEHDKYRHVVTSILNPKHLRTIKDEFQAKADIMVAEVAAQGEIEGIRELAARYPLQVFPDWLGIAPNGRENLLPFASMIFNTFGPVNHLYEKAVEEGSAAAGWVVGNCMPGDVDPAGFAAQIHASAAAAGFDENIQGFMVLAFLGAGVDTTVHSLGSALHCLAANPSQFELLKENPSLARAAFEETIRHASPVQTFFRTVSRDTVLSGVPLKEGSKVLMLLASANRDPRHWENPDDFDITRRTGGHVGFGFGIHACLGQMLARIEGECLLSAVARLVDRIELIGEPRIQLNNTLRGLEHLPLHLTPAA